MRDDDDVGVVHTIRGRGVGLSLAHTNQHKQSSQGWDVFPWKLGGTHLSMDLPDLFNHPVHSRTHLLWALSGRLPRRTTIIPDTPIWLFLPDVLCQHAFVLAVIPFRDVGVCTEEALGRGLGAEQLRPDISNGEQIQKKKSDQVSCALGSLAGRDDDVSDVCRVNQVYE